MSVLDRSCFSYQVAAGSTTSANNVVEVIRKSSASSRSSLPSGASSRQATSRGRWPPGASRARTEWDAPSRCLRKYSLPLPEAAGREFPGDELPWLLPGALHRVGEIERIPVEGRIRRHPAHPRRLRQQVGGGQAGEPRLACGRGERVGGEGVIAPLVGGQVPVGGAD